MARLLSALLARARGPLLVAATLLIAPAVTACAATAPTVAIHTVVTTTVPVYEFTTWFSVSAVEISCEIDHHPRAAATAAMNAAYCTSTSSALTHHVTVTSAGLVATCVGPACGSNAGLGTPSFYPGTEVRSGPFACQISRRAVTCREHHAHGFVITATSITKL